MMNRNEKLEIAKRLLLSTEGEMTSDDLEQMLEAELTKPESEMDTELVQQILELLEDAPTQAQQHESWQNIEKKLSFRRWRPVVSGLARIAAVGIILVALMHTTYSSAQAFNWEFLLRIIRPFAETFMVYTGDTPDPTVTPEANEVYDDEMMYCAYTEFATLADCPDKLDESPVKPTWMPERFTYLQGSMYTDMLITSLNHVFSSSEGLCIIDITKFRNNEDAISYHYEQLPQNNESMNVAGCQIAFYRNTQNEYLTAAWLLENTHYCITGMISEEEMIQAIETMMK